LRSCFKVRGLFTVGTSRTVSLIVARRRARGVERIIRLSRGSRARTCGTSRRIASSEACPWRPSSRTSPPCSPCSPFRLLATRRRARSVSPKPFPSCRARRRASFATPRDALSFARATREVSSHRIRVARAPFGGAIVRARAEKTARGATRDGASRDRLNPTTTKTHPGARTDDARPRRMRLKRARRRFRRDRARGRFRRASKPGPTGAASCRRHHRAMRATAGAIDDARARTRSRASSFAEAKR